MLLSFKPRRILSSCGSQCFFKENTCLGGFILTNKPLQSVLGLACASGFPPFFFLNFKVSIKPNVQLSPDQHPFHHPLTPPLTSLSSHLLSSHQKIPSSQNFAPCFNSAPPRSFVFLPSTPSEGSPPNAEIGFSVLSPPHGLSRARYNSTYHFSLPPTPAWSQAQTVPLEDSPAKVPSYDVRYARGEYPRTLRSSVPDIPYPHITDVLSLPQGTSTCACPVFFPLPSTH